MAKYLLTLHLDQNDFTLKYVARLLSEFTDIKIDYDYGMVTVSSECNLYAVRISCNNLNSLSKLGNIKQLHGVSMDVQTSSWDNVAAPPVMQSHSYSSTVYSSKSLEAY